jgi:hypothetical protein
MRDEESDAVRTVLQPLYQAYSGRYAFISTTTIDNEYTERFNIVTLTSMHSLSSSIVLISITRRMQIAQTDRPQHAHTCIVSAC